MVKSQWVQLVQFRTGSRSIEWRKGNKKDDESGNAKIKIESITEIVISRGPRGSADSGTADCGHRNPDLVLSTLLDKVIKN